MYEVSPHQQLNYLFCNFDDSSVANLWFHRATHDRNLGQFVVHLEPEAGFQFDEHSHLASDYYRW